MITKNFFKPRLILFLIVVLFALAMFWAARRALTPFLLGLVIAYIVLPLVDRFDSLFATIIRRRSLSRPLAILVVYLAGFVVIGGLLQLMLPPLVRQGFNLYRSVPALWQEATLLVNQGMVGYEQLELPPEIRLQIEQQMARFNLQTVLDPTILAARRALGTISSTVSFVLGLIVIPFWLFFILADEASVMRRVMRLIPHDLRPDVEAIRIIVGRVLSGYIRGQLVVASAYGVVITLGLMTLGIPFALVLGLVAGAVAIFPFIGAILGAIPSLVVAFLQSPEQGLYVLILFVVVQQLDNVFFSPKIMGSAVALHPALIMVVIVVGSSLLGVAGALIAVPATAIIRDVVNYLYIRVGEEPVSPIEALERVGYGEYKTPLLMPRALAPAGTD